MSLSELVSGMTPSTYTQIALLLFVGVFIAMAWRVRKRTQVHDTMAALPLNDNAHLVTNEGNQHVR